MNAIELQRVHKSFRSPDGLVEAVAGIDVTIKPGEIVAFLGPNGAGKTTTLDMLLPPRALSRCSDWLPAAPSCRARSGLYSRPVAYCGT